MVPRPLGTAEGRGRRDGAPVLLQERGRERGKGGVVLIARGRLDAGWPPPGKLDLGFSARAVWHMDIYHGSRQERSASVTDGGPDSRSAADLGGGPDRLSVALGGGPDDRSVAGMPAEASCTLFTGRVVGAAMFEDMTPPELEGGQARVSGLGCVG